MFRSLRRLPALITALIPGLLLGALLACGSGAPSARPADRNAVQVHLEAPQDLPDAARETLAYIRLHHAAPPGYEGGRRFGNYERRLPERDATGRRISYQEWDIHPRREHRNRGAERLITGSDGRAWFTQDHYGHFIEVERAP